MTTHPEINRMIEDPRLFDPVKYVELQPLQFRDDFQKLADVINPMNEQVASTHSQVYANVPYYEWSGYLQSY